MQYCGGKSYIANQVANVIREYITPNQTYVEPFCGMCSVGVALNHPKSAFYDASPYIIALWQALQAGWIPPTEVSEAHYNEVKRNREDYPMEYVCALGYGCAYAGKWFGSYAKSNNQENFARTFSRSAVRRVARLRNAHFEQADYANLGLHDCLIYCDPPYINATHGYDTLKFDLSEFEATVKRWRACGNTVIISEYVKLFDNLVEIAKFRALNHMGKERTEKCENLYLYAPDSAPKFIQPKQLHLIGFSIRDVDQIGVTVETQGLTDKTRKQAQKEKIACLT
jgi:DNA adenine methylase